MTGKSAVNATVSFVIHNLVLVCVVLLCAGQHKPVCAIATVGGVIPVKESTACDIQWPFEPDLY